MKTFRQGDAVKGLAKFRKRVIEAVRIDEPFAVEAIGSPMTGKAGDYLVRGLYGELYPVDAVDFERTYEPADAGDSA